MTQQITFAEFRNGLETRRLSGVALNEYLEIDPTAATLRVRFRPGALRDAPPPEYDVDEALYRYERARQLKTQEVPARRDLPRVVAEGDSWFHLPSVFLFPKAIADWIQKDGRFNVDNIAKWGRTLREVLAGKHYLDEIKSKDPAWLLVSGGGNDIQEALSKLTFLRTYKSSIPLDKAITDKGEELFRQIGIGYRTLLGEVKAVKPNLPVLCYAYDFPRPAVGDGTYIGQYLTAQHYPRETWETLCKNIIDRLTEVIQAAVSVFPHVWFLDCRHVTDSDKDWINDMHPGQRGFKALAAKFEARMEAQPRAKRRAVSPRGRTGPRQKAARGKSLT